MIKAQNGLLLKNDNANLEDFITKWLKGHAKKQRVKSEFLFKAPKTIKSKRVLAVTDDILDLLSAHQRYQKLLKLQSNGSLY